MEAQGAYDPTLELSNFKFPPLDLLNEYEVGKVQVTQEELNENKDKILETLTNFKIGIASIKGYKLILKYQQESLKSITK